MSIFVEMLLAAAAPAECWTWCRGVSADGYSRMWDPERRQMVGVHRYVWERAFGPVPPNIEVHHRCENRRCYRLSHLELVPKRQHICHHNSLYNPRPRSADGRFSNGTQSA